MKCSQCGGSVTWQGPLSALTHTECHECGAINAQHAEGMSECETCQGFGEIDQKLGGDARSPDIDCPDCGGSGEVYL